MAILAWFASRDLTQAAAISVLVTLVIAACALGRLGKTQLAVLLTAAGAGVAVTTALTLPADNPNWLVVLACFGLIAAVMGLVGVAGFGDRALGVGGTTGALLVLAVIAIIEAGASTLNAAATVAILGLAVLSLAPGIAMTTSGLSGLDDRLVTGHDAPRDHARVTVDAAYRSLTWLVTAATIVTAVCASVAAASAPWGRWLAVAITFVLVLRMRVFPLVPQRLALVLGALGIAVALVVGLPSAATTTAALMLAVLVAAVVLARPSPVIVARLNRVGDFTETLAVVALMPLLLALWGVFGDLTGAF